MKTFVDALWREQDVRVRLPLPALTGFIRMKRFGLGPTLLGTVPSLPFNPARARVGQPERMADKRKPIKDETDEDHSQIFARKT